MKVHIKCRRNFTDSKRLSSAEKASEPLVKKKRLRSTGSGFDWKMNCFLCTKYAEVDPRHLDRGDAVQARTLPIRQNFLDQCNLRNDQWAITVKGRLQNCRSSCCRGSVPSEMLQ